MKNKDIALTDTQRDMVEANMDVVRWAIHTSVQVNEQRYGFGYDDLFQEGCIWLCKAAVTYDPDGGASFPTYAQKVVENGLRTYRLIVTARYIAIDGVCIAIMQTPLRKYRNIRIIDSQEHEMTLVLPKQDRIEIGRQYRFYFKSSERILTGSSFLDASLPTDGFLGFEEMQ